MNSPGAFEGAAPARGQVFRYEGFTIDGGAGAADLPVLAGRAGVRGAGVARARAGWDTPAARAAARIVYLLAGVSYYKTAAPPVIDLGDTALTERELAFLREFYLSGLGEYAYRNGLDLSDLIIHATPAAPALAAPRPPAPLSARCCAHAPALCHPGCAAAARCGRSSPLAAASTRS